jgi:HAE1 family hydrophobic/amphiphilic exporter-1
LNNIYDEQLQKVAISQFDFERIYGPEAVSRFNMLKSVNVNGKSNPGFSSGDAIIAVQEVAQHLPKTIPMSSRIDQRRNYSRNQAIGCFY